MKPITDIPQLDLKKQYTYADYLTWRFEERVELINGWLYRLGTAPRLTEKNVITNLWIEIYRFFETKDVEVYHELFDIRLTKHKVQNHKINTVVQADISVICGLDKLVDAGCLGAADHIVEVLSDDTAKKDYNEKFNLYEENKVKEHWIANPATKNIEIFSLIDEKYESLGLFRESEDQKEVVGTLFPEMKISLKAIFTD